MSEFYQVINMLTPYTKSGWVFAIEKLANDIQAALDAMPSNPSDGKTSILAAVSDETTVLEAGTSKLTFRMPHAMTAVSVRASLTTAQASGNILTIDINQSGVSILSTKLTIDNTEKSSFSATIPAVVSTTSLADDSEITIDIDQIGDGTAAGLKVYLTGIA